MERQMAQVIVDRHGLALLLDLQDDKGDGDELNGQEARPARCAAQQHPGKEGKERNDSQRYWGSEGVCDLLKVTQLVSGWEPD